MKEQIKKVIRKAIEKLYPKHQGIDFIVDQAPANIDADFASNAAMVLAKKEGKKPMEVGEALISALTPSPRRSSGAPSPARGEGYKVETIAPGFLNFKLSSKAWQEELEKILKLGEKYGSSSLGKGKKVNVEFVSANPTGPLTVGHGRGAVIGLVVSNVLKSQGYKVVREYYYNDGGLQMKSLGISVQQRALNEYGESLEISGSEGTYDLYQGAYIKNIAKEFLGEKEIKNAGEARSRDVKEYSDFAAERILDSINKTLNDLGVHFDSFVRESKQDTEKTLKLLKKEGTIYPKEGALWLRNKEGKEDRVLVRKTGEHTYRLPDIAYHLQKVKQFDKVITVLGADHISQFPDISYAVEKLGGDSDKIQVIVNQFVTLAGGKKMSTRKANYVTLDELLEEVGPDVTKFFMLMSAPSAHMNFDIDLAKDTSEKNPVYKVQYAYARIHSILKKAVHNAPFTPSYLKRGEGELLRDPHELGLIKELTKFPELIQEIAVTYTVHHLPHYLLGLAEKFHKFYEKVRVISEDEKLTAARLSLVMAVKTVLSSGLKLMGIEPREKM